MKSRAEKKAAILSAVRHVPVGADQLAVFALLRRLWVHQRLLLGFSDAEWATGLALEAAGWKGRISVVTAHLTYLL